MGNRTNIANINNVNINRANNFIRPTHADWNRGDWYHGDWHGNWTNGWYYRPLGWWSAGYWAGTALSAIPWSWGYWPYYNPYCVGPIIDYGVTIDYSQPIVAAQPVVVQPDQPGLAQPVASVEDQATPFIDAARTAFMQGDYTTALAKVDQAIALVPNDTVLHEFRGLALLPSVATRKRPPPTMPSLRPVPVGTGRRSAACIRTSMSTRSNSAPWKITPGRTRMRRRRDSCWASTT